MTYATKSDALAEARRMPRIKHRTLPVYRHNEGCLVSDGTIIPAYPCTCNNARHAGWTLQLITK